MTSQAEENVFEFLSQPHMHPNILRANVLARRLDKIVQEMGTAISDGLYRRARDAVLRGDYHFITAEDNSLEVFRELQRQEPLPRVTVPSSPDIGLPQNPRELREVWEGLSLSDKEELFHLDPLLGNRAGIPITDRDFYCRRTLQNFWEQARTSGDEDLAAIYHDMTRMLNGRVRGQPPFYLSYIDRDGKAAFSLGNPDLADNNVVLLRPVGPRDPVAYGEPNLRQLRRIALAVEPTRKTAVSFCSTYPHPESLVQAIFPQFAEDSAAMVRNYHEGLRASHVGAPAHTTTVGHSHAGVVAGHAAGGGATLAVDNMILMGNWGTGVNHVDELSLGGAPGRAAENVFPTMDWRDPLQLMPRTHGPSPIDPEFGAQRVFGTDSPPGDSRWNPHTHAAGHYLNSSNPSAGSIGLIITGHGDLVT